MHSNSESSRHQQRRINACARAVHSYDFFNLLTGPQLLELVDQQLPPHRERLYSPTDTLSLYMAQALSPDASCQQAVNRHAVERVVNGLAPCSTHTGAYCKARQRLPLTMVKTLTHATGQQIAAQAPATWLWRGRPVKLVDGTTVTMPDTPANQERYPQQSNQKPGLGFPIARLVGLLCLATGAVLDAAMGPYSGKTGSEHALFRELIDRIAAGDLILADRYYCAYFVIALLRARGADVLFQQHQRRITDFRQGRRLGARDHVVIWEKPKIRPEWLSQEQYDACPDTQAIREVQVKSKVLVTTLLSSAQAPKNALGDLYVRRWDVEVDLRNIKTTLGMEVLRCKTPQMNDKELWVYLLAYNLIRVLMARSAEQAGVPPRQISFKHALQVWLALSHHGPPDDEQVDEKEIQSSRARSFLMPCRDTLKTTAEESTLMIPRFGWIGIARRSGAEVVFISLGHSASRVHALRSLGFAKAGPSVYLYKPFVPGEERMSEQTLWIVTAGNSDIQFPLHRLSTGDSARFTPARDVRKLHEALIELAKGGRLTVLNSSQPLRHGRDGGRPDKAWTSGASLQVTGTEDGGLALSYTNPDFVLDLAGTTGVPVHLPKVQPLLDPLRQYGKNLTVVVVGTRRDQDSEEPIAVGPVLCEYLSNQLGLTLSGALDTEGGTRSTLTPGSCVWLNILIGDERLEEIDSQRSMIGRVQEALEAWERGLSAAAQNGSIRRVLVTSSGGMALVKEILERVSAIRFGDGQVSIFKEQPSQQAVSVVISEPYLNRVTERLALRLHCAESFRSMKWYSAYGLAGLVKEDWSRSIKRLIEPLLRLPGNGNIGRDICRPAIHENRVISSLELAAYQLEISWRMGDSVTTLQIFSAFLESAIQRLSENSTRLSAAGGRVRNNATILGLPAHSHDTLFGNMDAERSRRLITGPERRGDKVFSKIRSLVADSAWIDFLCEGVANGSERSALQAAGDLVLKYNERSAPGADDSLRELRNRLAHEIDDGLSNQIRRRLEALFAPAAGQPAPISFLEPNGNVATLVRHPGNVAGNPKEIFESLVRWGSRCIQEGQR